MTVTWETASQISQVVIAVAASVGLTQLWIAKNDIKIRSQREAMTLAAQQIDRFRENIPQIDKLLAMLVLLKSNKRIRLDEYTHEEVQNKYLEEYKSFEINFTNPDYQRLMVDVGNIMESFSVYFSEKIADEEIAFLPIAPMFCEVVERNYFFYCFHRKQRPFLYNHTIKLYSLWSKKIKKNNLLFQQETLSREIATVDVASPRPLGTE